MCIRDSSALDFPFCFLAVRWLGTERVGYAEHVVVEAFWSLVGVALPSVQARRQQSAQEGVVLDEAEEREGGAGAGWGVETAEARNKSDKASLWTQLALAYAIHKSFIFVRVPLTAAVLPKVVKTLRSWGWNIGKRTSKVGGK